MGTRNLTAVMSGGKYVIAQYGQWDGHPRSQGVTALEFCRSKLQSEASRARFLEQLEKIQFVTDEQVKDWLGQVGSSDGWLTFDQAREFDELAPYLSRDHGAKILDLVFSSRDEIIYLRDSISFAGDSLFCEYAYVIDLDKNTFEAYKGFRKTPLSPEERFVNSPVDERHTGKYYPISLVARWSLDKLPTNEELCDAYRTDEDDEDE